jgi:hypothetical protein
MNPSIYLLIIIVIVLFIKINALPRYRYRRQINPIEGIDQRMQRQNNPSGSIVGTYYYGVYNFQFDNISIRFIYM